MHFLYIYHPQTPTPSEPLDELLGQYWDIGYKEGQFGEPNGDKANEVLHKIRALFKPLQPITADDVTGEMILEYTRTAEGYQQDKPFTYKSLCAAAYNAVIKHRSESK